MKIWCVEDDGSIRDIEVYTLNSTDFEATGFSDAAAFRDALSTDKPDLIILDIMLPGEDGVELLKFLKDSPDTCRIPVIMATAKGMEYNKIQSLDLGADDYLVKSLRYSTTLLEKTLYCAKRLNDGSALRISVSSVTVWVIVLGMIQPILIVVVVALVLSGVLASRISKHIMEPLNSLDLEKPLENDTYEELSPLLNRINKQHRQIDMQLLELQRKNDEFTQITQSMTEGLVLLNEKNIILNINPAALKLFHTKKSCIGKDFLTVERSHDVSHAIQDAFSNGHSEIRMECEKKEYRLHVNRIESNGVVIGAVVFAFDITDAAFAERNRREFTANVSHELKTPLQSIIGSAELMENGLVKSEDMTRFVRHIRTEAGRLVILIDDISACPN